MARALAIARVVGVHGAPVDRLRARRHLRQKDSLLHLRICTNHATCLQVVSKEQATGMGFSRSVLHSLFSRLQEEMQRGLNVAHGCIPLNFDATKQAFTAAGALRSRQCPPGRWHVVVQERRRTGAGRPS